MKRACLTTEAGIGTGGISSVNYDRTRETEKRDEMLREETG